MGWFLKSWRPAHNAKHVVFTYFIYLHDIFMCKVSRKFHRTWLSESKTGFLSCRRKYRSISPLIISWNCSRLNSPCSPRSRPLSGTHRFTHSNSIEVWKWLASRSRTRKTKKKNNIILAPEMMSKSSCVKWIPFFSWSKIWDNEK